MQNTQQPLLRAEMTHVLQVVFSALRVVLDMCKDGSLYDQLNVAAILARLFALMASVYINVSWSVKRLVSVWQLIY